MISRGQLDGHIGGRIPHKPTARDAAFLFCFLLGDECTLIVLVDAVLALMVHNYSAFWGGESMMEQRRTLASPGWMLHLTLRFLGRCWDKPGTVTNGGSTHLH